MPAQRMFLEISGSDVCINAAGMMESSTFDRGLSMTILARYLIPGIGYPPWKSMAEMREKNSPCLQILSRALEEYLKTSPDERPGWTNQNSRGRLPWEWESRVQHRRRQPEKISIEENPGNQTKTNGSHIDSLKSNPHFAKCTANHSRASPPEKRCPRRALARRPE
jgi:hypothetical protein